jgi:hypothetical protein
MSTQNSKLITQNSYSSLRRVCRHHDGIALACRSLQVLLIQNMNDTATVSDGSLLLKHACCYGYGCPTASQNPSQSFLSQGQAIGNGAFASHEQPFAEPFLNGVKLIANSVLGHLNEKSIHMVEQKMAEDLGAFEFPAQNVAPDAKCAAGKLNDGTERSELSENRSHIDDSLVTDHAHLQRVTFGRVRKAGDHRVFGEIDVNNRLACFVKDCVLIQLHELEMLSDQSKFPGG